LKRPILLLIVLFVLALNSMVDATARIWVGTTTAWNTASNWAPSGIPTSADDLTIGATANQPTITTTAGVCNSITFSGGGTVIITLGADLTVTTTMTGAYGTSLSIANSSGIRTLGVGTTISVSGGSNTFSIAANDKITCTGITTGNNVALSNSGTINCSGTLSIQGTLTNTSSGSISCNKITMGNAYSISNSGTIISASNVAISGAAITNASGSIFTINSGTLSIGNGSNINNSGTFSLTGNLTSGGSNITNSNIFNVSACTYTVNNGDVITNNTGATFTVSGNSNWDFSGGGKIVNSNIFYAGTAASPCILNMGNFNSKITNNATGIFYLGSTSFINFYSNITSTYNTNTGGVVVNNGTFTLQSDANGSAGFGQTGASGVITGTYNVQRFLTGGNVNLRSYRLLSSPVNATSKTDGTGNISLGYVNTTKIIGGVTYYGALTAGPGGGPNGFTVANANPTLYLYNESLASNNNGFTSGKNVGVVVVGTSTVSTVSGSTTTANVSIPVGNGFMFYYIGDNHLTTTTNTRVPENTTLTAVGTMNQWNVPVKLWRNSSTSLDATNNLVGNPYPSTIDLNKVYSDNTIGQVFYELYNVNPGQPYVSYSYNGTVGTTSGTNASRYIASGQGFFVTATAGQTITFKEDQKVSQQLTTSSAPYLLMSTPAQRVVQTNNTITLPDAVNSAAPFSTQQDNVATGLHLAMMQDSSVYDECGIYFFKDGIDKYDSSDAIDLDGVSPRVYMSSFTTDGKRTGINILGNYAKGKRVKLFVKAITDGVYKLNLTDIQNIDITNYNLYLKDNYAKDSLDLNHNPSYSFRIQNSDTTSFGANRFELVLTPKPLPPYALIAFTAKKVNEGVLLTWTTANEGNYTGFTLEKQNGAQFIALNNLQSNGAGTYTYIDHNPTTGTNAYRLMQSGLEANISYSETVSALYNSDPLTIYPNPAKDNINLYVNVPGTDSNSTYQMSIYDPSGTLILTKQISKTYTQTVGTLRLGTYIVRVTDNNGKLVGNNKFSKLQ
jgi:hypothetical protein